MYSKVIPRLLEATQRGRLPIVCDASSCTEGLTQLVDKAATNGTVMRVVDAVEFVGVTLLPKLEVRRRLPSLALHPTCSSTRLGSADAFVALARMIAEVVVVPADWACCGFAGDRGMLHPELTASATRCEAADLAGREFTAYASSNRTCEIGMTRATGREYAHLIELVEQATRPETR
jgi:D-lactate dehydrogenase